MAEVQTVEEKREQAAKFFGVKTEEQQPPAKTEQEIAAEKKAEEDRLAFEAKEKDEKDKKEIPAVVEQKQTLSDEELLALMSEKAGRKIASWDDLKEKAAPTEDDKKKLIEARDADKLTYGLKQGLFNRNQYESFIADSKNPKDLVYGRELAEAKAEDKDWDAEKEKEFKDEFDEKFGIDLDPTSSKHKRGQKQISMLAEQILKSEYAPIFSLDNVYDKYEGEQTTRQQQEQKILSLAPQYKEDVTKVVADFSKVELDFGGEKFEVPVSEEILKQVSEVMLDNNFSTQQITSGYKKDQLTEFVKQYVIGQNYQTLAFEAAKQYRQKHEKGLRGIPDGGKLEKKEDPYANLDEKQRKALEFFRGPQVLTQVAN